MGGPLVDVDWEGDEPETWPEPDLPTVGRFYIHMTGKDGAAWTVRFRFTREPGKLSIDAKARRRGQPHETRQYYFATCSGTARGLLDYARRQVQDEL